MNFSFGQRVFEQNSAITRETPLTGESKTTPPRSKITALYRRFESRSMNLFFLLSQTIQRSQCSVWKILRVQFVSLFSPSEQKKLLSKIQIFFKVDHWFFWVEVEVDRRQSKQRTQLIVADFVWNMKTICYFWTFFAHFWCDPYFAVPVGLSFQPFLPGSFGFCFWISCSKKAFLLDVSTVTKAKEQISCLWFF